MFYVVESFQGCHSPCQRHGWQSTYITAVLYCQDLLCCRMAIEGSKDVDVLDGCEWGEERIETLVETVVWDMIGTLVENCL